MTEEKTKKEVILPYELLSWIVFTAIGLFLLGMAAGIGMAFYAHFVLGVW